MPDFVLNRTHNLQGKGHDIVFRKGQPTFVPPCLVREAIGIGAEPVNGDKDAYLPADEAPEEQLTPDDKEALVFAAFDEILTRNDSGDFGADSKPTIEAVKKLVKFNVVKKEIVALFQKYRAAKNDDEK